MTNFTEFDNMERIARLESTVMKQQAEINWLITMGEHSANLFSQISKIINGIAAGNNDGL